MFSISTFQVESSSIIILSLNHSTKKIGISNLCEIKNIQKQWSVPSLFTILTTQDSEWGGNGSLFWNVFNFAEVTYSKFLLLKDLNLYDNGRWFNLKSRYRKPNLEIKSQLASQIASKIIEIQLKLPVSGRFESSLFLRENLQLSFSHKSLQAAMGPSLHWNTRVWPSDQWLKSLPIHYPELDLKVGQVSIRSVSV